MRFVFPPRPQPALPITGRDDLYPVGRIFCIGRNYADHAAEMGNTVDRTMPFYFTKSAHHLAASSQVLPIAPGTQDYHHEVELVVALGAPLFRADPKAALAAVWGYGVGLDMTRRDLQARAKDKRHPWDAAKDAEGSAIVGALTPVAAFGVPGAQRIALTVNGALRQEGHLSDMVFPVGELLAHLSTLHHLAPGDLVMTGTPAGVGPVQSGDVLDGTVDGLAPVRVTFGDAQ